MQRRGGFTATQFIVVAAIVILLAAALWSVGTRPRERRHDYRTYCPSNLKQIGLAIHMYTNDNDNRLPQDGYRSQGRDIGWEEAVLPYIKNDKIYYCPMQFYDRRGEWVGRDMRSLPFGYGANRTYLITSFPTPTVLVSDVKNPEATILLGDQSEFARGIYSPIAGRGVRMKPPCNVPPRHDEWGTPPGQGKRQKGGANFVFADGHVKWMKAGASWSRDDSMWDLK